jgi:hypothetical protein
MGEFVMKNLTLVVLIALLIFGIAEGSAMAEAPFNNLEGVGGVAYNPLAYLGGSSQAGSEKQAIDNTALGEMTKWIGKPRFGTWYVNLSDVGINWFSAGLSTSIADRLEISYGYQNIGQKDAKTHAKNNIGAKLLLVPENFHDWNWVPAISVGAIYKHTDNVLPSARHDGWDGYIVASKTVTFLPRPVILSGGGLLTSSYATGALGYDKQSKATLFGNVDLLLTDHILLGFEYKQGPDFNNFKNADYWDAHVAWLANKNLTIIAAYTYTGDQKSTKNVGLGNGVVISAQYSF